MNLNISKLYFKRISILIGIILIGALVLYFGLMIFQPQIVPSNETFGSFWIKNFSILIATLAFATSTLFAAYNALEQRHLRFMENYPYLEISPIMTVDPLPLPVPRNDVPPELANFNIEYLKKVAPSQEHKPSAIELRYLALTLRNVGNGFITRVTINGMAEVPETSFPGKEFMIDKRFNLAPGATHSFTLLPISGLPEFKVNLKSVKYYGHFVDLTEFEGLTEYRESYPFEIPFERRETVFLDDFVTQPTGNGWILDFWGSWQPTSFIYINRPIEDQHYLVLSGDKQIFSQNPHFQNQGGAYKDLMNIIDYGVTVKVTARIRSIPKTSASIQLWCHDLVSNSKTRYTEPVIPSEEWQDLSMLYTSTQSPNLRIHLLYTPGVGEIHVDRVTVEVLYT